MTVLLTAWTLACAGAETPAPPAAAPLAAPAPVPAPPPWPSAGAPLRSLPPLPPLKRPVRLVIDAGHGAPGNTGNTSARCESEADFTRRAQDQMVARLENAPELSIRSGRPTPALVDYGARIAAFDAWPADAVISLHSDVREGEAMFVEPTSGCWANHGASGFAVLFSDEGDAALAGRRRRLAEAVAVEMASAGFAPYTQGYSEALYGRVADGVYVDRHAVGKRIRMLRGTHVPTVIVETHQAIDPDEAARWAEPATMDAFAAALRRAAVAAGLGGPHG